MDAGVLGPAGPQELVDGCGEELAVLGGNRLAALAPVISVSRLELEHS